MTTRRHGAMARRIAALALSLGTSLTVAPAAAESAAEPAAGSAAGPAARATATTPAPALVSGPVPAPALAPAPQDAPALADGSLIREPGGDTVSILVGGRRAEFANMLEALDSECLDRPVHTVSPLTYRALPLGPDPLYAAAQPGVDADRITPEPAYRKNCKPLYRADGRGPEVIFKEGFRARGVNGQYDLEKYVLQNHSSPYVSTTYDGTLYKRWGAAYHYHIDAPGGIDVNRTIGDTHIYAGEVEVSFPGGVDRRFIVKACPVDQETRTEKTDKCVDNPHYRPWRGQWSVGWAADARR